MTDFLLGNMTAGEAILVGALLVGMAFIYFLVVPYLTRNAQRHAVDACFDSHLLQVRRECATSRRPDGTFVVRHRHLNLLSAGRATFVHKVMTAWGMEWQYEDAGGGKFVHVCNSGDAFCEERHYGVLATGFEHVDHDADRHTGALA